MYIINYKNIIFTQKQQKYLVISKKMSNFAADFTNLSDNFQKTTENDRQYSF